ncbi:RDD family protein [Akkermansiaceae bacterium]|nr:RDD family protein [Akkermansiaceae bacterium]
MEGVKRRLDTLQTVELADGVEVHLRTAGPFLRLMAFLLDMLIKFGISIVFYLVLILSSPALGDNVTMGIMTLFSFFLQWFYDVFFEVGAKGATWGKRVAGIRVVTEGGATVSIGQSMVRNIIRIVELYLPLLPLVAFFNPRFQRLGDLAGGTLVVYAKENVDLVYAGPPSMSAVPVNVPLTREERAAMISFRHRAGGWSEARRAELTNHLSPLTGQVGPKGVGTVTGMAQWLEEES